MTSEAASYTRGTLKILYATETGTAEEFSEVIANEASCRWYRPQVLSISDYTEVFNLLFGIPPHSLFCIFIASVLSLLSEILS